MLPHTGRAIALGSPRNGAPITMCAGSIVTVDSHASRVGEIAGLVGFNYDITLPVFAVILGAVIFGLALGFVWEWVREHKHRVTAATERKERERLEADLKKVAPTSDKGDDVLALLEAR